MDTAEILAMIVEQACLYVPDVPVGSFKEKRPKETFKRVQVPKEEPFNVEKSPKEALTVIKVPVAASDLVRIKWNCLNYLV